MAPPTFDVAVEIVDRHCWRVHLDLAAAVDAALKGACFSMACAGVADNHWVLAC